MCRAFVIYAIILFASAGVTKASDAEVVRIQTDDGVSVSANWYPPPPGASPFVIVTAHDGWEDSRVWQPLIPEWRELGYGVLNLDFRGFGKSFENTDTERFACASETPDYSGMPNDIIGAIEFVRKRHQYANTVIVGSGDGADLALLVASRDSRVLGVAELAPGAAYPQAAYPGEDIVDILTQYGSRPLLIMTAIPWTGMERNTHRLIAIVDSLGASGPNLVHTEYETACGLNFTTLRMIPDVVPDLNAWLAYVSGDEGRDLTLVTQVTTPFVVKVSPQNVTINGVDDFPIRASIYHPTRSDSLVKAILLVHGASGSQAAWNPYLDSFLNNGWTVVTVDMRGHGESVLPDNGSSHWCRSWESVKDNMGPDLSHVADYVTERYGDIHIAAMGGSMGGNSALLAAAENDAVDAVILLSSGLARPRFELAEVLTQYGAERPLLVIAAEGDHESYDAGTRVAELRPQTTMHVIPRSCTHAEPLLGEEPELLPYIMQWLRDTE
jgi:pimeloyl-ACP methyl ester carboxylesterase